MSKEGYGFQNARQHNGFSCDIDGTCRKMIKHNFAPQKIYFTVAGRDHNDMGSATP